MTAAVADFFQKQQIPAIVRPIKTSAPLYTSPDHPFIKRFVALGSRLTGANWFCDAAFFALARHARYRDRTGIDRPSSYRR